jgi:arylsulfatase A-like enzyme
MEVSTMSRLRLLLIVILFAPLMAAARAPAADAKPNIVFVISDDQRWDCLGAAGNPNIVTPAQDRLAKQGTYYRQATIHVPQCSPSRATLLTGLAPHQHGWFSNQAAESSRTDPAKLKNLPMLPKLLHDAGYRTILIGKWHLIPEPWDCGFTDVRVWLPGGGGPYENAGLAHGNSRQRTKTPGFTNQIFGDDAVTFLRSDDAAKQPFFLWLALTAPHMPIQPNPADIQKLYADKTKQQLMPPNFPHDRDAGDWKHYYEACSMADRQLENVLNTLDEKGLAKNTMVIFLGDNGFMMGGRDVPQFKKNKPYMGKVFPYEDSVRVPMIVRMPEGGPNRGTNDEPVSSIDLPPTILQAAGVTPPKDMPGHDLFDPQYKPAEAFCEFADNESDKFGEIAYRLVRTPKYKLIVYESRPEEMYDVAKDPQEQKSLANDPAAAEVKADLRKRLDEWMRKTKDPALEWKKPAEQAKAP